MNLTFKNALLISTSFHLAFFAPLAAVIPANRPVENKRPFVVDYVKIAEPVKAKPYITPKVPETPAVETDKKIEMKTVDVKRPSAAQSIKKMPQDTRKQAIEDAKLKSSKEYISYYHLIREKIRQNLKNYYRPYHGQGDVALAFTLGSDGSLIDCVIENTPQGYDKRLGEVAILSVKKSSPLPSFPEALSRDSMTFNLTISFKKQ